MSALWDSYFYLLFASAGVGFFSTFLINNLNDWLLKKRWSVIHPDTMISIDIFKVMQPVDSMKIGMYSLFLMGWLGTLVFMILWLLPLFQSIAVGSILLAAFIYVFAIYVFMMLVFLPLVHRGFFGVLYHKDTPYWSAALLVVYALLLAVFVPAVI